MLMIEQELKEMGAPTNVVDAGRLIDRASKAHSSPPLDVVQFVAEWVTRQRGNNRYGK